jgi:hypothetical protein
MLSQEKEEGNDVEMSIGADWYVLMKLSAT